jgi:hypothetical protein
VNDTTFLTILVSKFLYKLEAVLSDIEIDFLYVDLEEKLWMDLPEGYVDYIHGQLSNGKAKEIPFKE